MKKIFPILCLSFWFSLSYSQIALENAYPNSGYFSKMYISSAGYYGAKPFYMVKLEISGDKYVMNDIKNQTLYFYNLNHTFFKSISYSAVPLLGFQSIDNEKIASSIMYISENLFDTDPQIEFIYTYSYLSLTSGATTQIVNEDGTLLFSANNEAPLVKPSFHSQYYPIYNTPLGTKMILSCKTDSTAKVYSLPGTFSNIVKDNNIYGENLIAKFSPNPTSDQLKLNYKLPEGSHKAELKIFDASGKLMDEVKVTDDFDFIYLPTNYNNGLYLYSLIVDGKIIKTEKIVLNK